MLFLLLQRASICRYISFQRLRIPAENVKQLISEMQTVGYIKLEIQYQWKKMMTEHNSIVQRGENMKLLGRRRSFEWIKFSSIDLYMLQMQSRYLSCILDEFSNFGERVLLCMDASSSALFWILEAPILIERASWHKLCSQIMSLLRFLGLDSRRKRRLPLSPWPDRELLVAAAARAQQLFGRFARPDPHTPTLAGLLGRAGERQLSTADIAQAGCKARRWRASSMQSESAPVPRDPARAVAERSSGGSPVGSCAAPRWSP